jgi:hypothetical protein
VDTAVLYLGGNPSKRSADGGVTWVALGDFPSSSAYSPQIAVDPSGHDVIYAAASSGIFKSSNRGATWTQTGWKDAADKIALDPATSGVIYATKPSGYSLLKSSDGGDSWSQLRNDIDSFEVDRTTAGILTAKTTAAKLIRTLDGGATWTELRSVVRFATHPLLSDTIYASQYTYPDISWMKSTDGGASWVPWSALPGPGPNSQESIGRSDPLVMYGSGGSAWALGLWKTVTGGE